MLAWLRSFFRHWFLGGDSDAVLTLADRPRPPGDDWSNYPTERGREMYRDVMRAQAEMEARGSASV